MANRAKTTNGATAATPRWVKALAVFGLVLALLFVLLHVTGHGFGAHMHASMGAPGASR